MWKGELAAALLLAVAVHKVLGNAITRDPRTESSGSSVVIGTAPFNITGALTEARASHTATLLLDGRVLVAGGLNGTQRLASAELFDRATGRWSVTGSLKTRRNVHTATLLPNGKVLVTGGNTTGYQPLRSSELYDPVTGLWTGTGDLVKARAYQQAVLLPTGRVLVVGGNNDLTHTPLTSAELYDPATGQWTETGSLRTPRAYHTATLLPNGKVLVAGGGQNGLSDPFSTGELYDPLTGKWTETGAMATPRAHHTATLLQDGSVLVVGGANATDLNNSASSAERYNPRTGRWMPTGPLSIGRWGHAAALLGDGGVLVTGGISGARNLASAERYDPAAGEWTPTASMSEPREAHTTTPLNDGTVLVAAGVDLGPAQWLASAETYGSPAPELSAPELMSPTRLANGAVQFTFTDQPSASFVVYATTNLLAPFSQWTALGAASETAPGQFQFTDLDATNSPLRFYRVTSQGVTGLAR